MRSWTYVIAGLLALQPLAAEACSFSWQRGHSPAEIRANPDMRQVRGTFHFIEVPGGNGRIAANAQGWLYGRIDVAGGHRWDTIQAPMHEISIECGSYIAPTANGLTGRFWISRERRNGRYRLMLWAPDPVREAAVPRR